MPLLDHFRPPLEHAFPWTSLLSSWAVRLEDRLNEFWIPDELIAFNAIKIGFEVESPLMSDDSPSVGIARQRPGDPPVQRPPWEVPPPEFTFPRTKGDHVEVHIRSDTQLLDLHAVVAFVTPTNKETLQQRRAFLSRCVSHLHEGASLAVIDVITSFPYCLYNDLLTMLGAEDVPRLPTGSRLFAAAFRPVSRGNRQKAYDPNERLETDVWIEPVVVGQPVPSVPLRVIYDIFVPLEFELGYQDNLRRHRFP